jgi:hypothetical protein
MKLSNKSLTLMSFFTDNNFIIHSHQTRKTQNTITEIYNDILNAYKYIIGLKKIYGNNLYNISIKQIQSATQIKKPKGFNSSSFPEEIRNHIYKRTTYELTYTFSLFEKEIRLFFILETPNVEHEMKVYNKYVDSIVMWLYILNKYASKFCAKQLDIYLYFTSLSKYLPSTDANVLDENHANTAFTTTCPRESEIVIFRKEEWFKVLIHETFHNFGLDFSGMNTDKCTSDMLNIFPVASEVNLYESYAEFWAEIINALFCSFFKLKNKNNVEEFLAYSEYFINLERTHSFFQLVKTLHYMGLKYESLFKKDKTNKLRRETLYKEKTSILAYYIIKTILMNNYQGFLDWCQTNNYELYDFKKTQTNIDKFCLFIKKNYKSNEMLDNVERMEHFFIANKNNSREKKEKYNFIMNNMRMSICELG